MIQKRKRWETMLFVIACGFLLVGATVSAEAQQPYEKIAGSNEWEELKLVNKERLADDKEPLSIFENLQKGANVRASELIGKFSHTRPDGTSCFTILDDYNIKAMLAGENIAAGQQSPEQVMHAWMNSPGHRSNILKKGYKHIGIGYAQGGAYAKNWTQVFVGGCNFTKCEPKGLASVYPVGTQIDDMQGYLAVTCDMHGTSYVPIIKEMCTGYNPSKSGKQTITISWRGLSVKAIVSNQTEQPQTPEKEDTTPVKPIAKVTGLKSVSVTKHTVKLKWTKKDCDGYEVFRAVSKNGTYKRIKSLPGKNKNSYKCTGLRSGKRYYFKVRAYKKVNGRKKYGACSTIKSVKTYVA